MRFLQFVSGNTDIGYFEKYAFQHPERKTLLEGVSELKGISEKGDTTAIGAGVTIEELHQAFRESPDSGLKALSNQCRYFANTQIRNHATLGGEIISFNPYGDLLRGRNSDRMIICWFNARNLQQAFYEEEFEALQREFPNFTFRLALFRPNPEDHWSGPTGYPAKILYREQLRDHPAPEDIEYYICGPWLMTDSILRLLDDLGVERDNIFYDDFGS